MVKITDGRTPPATELYREGWERIFGKKIKRIDFSEITVETIDASKIKVEEMK